MRLLWERFIVSSAFRPPSCGGRYPIKLFSLRSRNSNLSNLERCTGITPSNLLPLRFKLLNFKHSPSFSWIRPVKEFFAKLRTSKLSKLPNSEGIVPDNELSSKYNFINELNLSRLFGILPTK
ncbi:hypothetical protein HanIR_Chr02g0065891 [Helianthus annuus]|nr:hypothetical protein HanIR_Chr02g0065891 [Helianthus annuus]